MFEFHGKTSVNRKHEEAIAHPKEHAAIYKLVGIHWRNTNLCRVSEYQRKVIDVRLQDI